MSGHIVVTWALANIFHPLLLAFYFSHDIALPEMDDIGPFFQLMLISFVCSMPSLLLSLLTGTIISKMDTDAGPKFLIWLIVAPLIAVLNWVLLGLLFSWELLDMALPSVMAVTLANLLRINLFLKAVTSDGKTSETDGHSGEEEQIF